MSRRMTTMELIEKGIGHNCLSDAYDLGRADERPSAFGKGYDSGYQRGRADALKEAFDKTYTKAYDSGYENAEKEHKAMCESCIHKVSAEDVLAIRNSAIEKCAEIISKNMRCESCPVDCLWWTEQKCKDTLALYLKTQIEEQKNG